MDERNYLENMHLYSELKSDDLDILTAFIELRKIYGPDRQEFLALQEKAYYLMEVFVEDMDSLL